MIVLDTSVLVEHLRGNPSATKFLADEARRGDLVVPAIGAWELWKGAETPQRRERVQALLDSMVVEPFMPAMAQVAAELHLAHRREGRDRPVIDLFIASHALYHRAPLATLDRDFDGISALDVIRLRA